MYVLWLVSKQRRGKRIFRLLIKAVFIKFVVFIDRFVYLVNYRQKISENEVRENECRINQI